MRLELVVGRVTRGKIKDVNTHKVYVEAPPVGTTLVVTVGGVW